MCTPSAHRGRNRPPDSLELDSQRAVSHQSVLGIKSMSSVRVAKVLNHWAVSPTPARLLFTERHYQLIINLVPSPGSHSAESDIHFTNISWVSAVLGTVQERSNLYPALRELTLRKKMTARTQTSMHQSMPKSKVRHGSSIPVTPVLGKFKVKFRYIEWEVSQFKTQSQLDRTEQQQKPTTPKKCVY